MRPLELNLTAFRSYVSETIDFRPHALVVISGDTGAGKTSILDAIAFALYGRTPEQSSSRELLTLGAAHGEVRLTFEASGRTWRVTRRLGAGAPEPMHLLEELTGDGGDSIDHVTGAGTVNSRLVELVGMGFPAFTSAVMLAQGRFAQFLQASPRDRDVILRELFGIASLEAVRTGALARREAADREVSVLARERGLLPDHRPAVRNAAGTAVRQASARHAALRTLRPIADAARRARSREHDAASAAAQIADALGDLAPVKERRELVEQHDAARRAAETARAESDAAQHALSAAIGRRDALRAEHGGTSAELAVLRGLAERSVALRDALPGEESAIAHEEAELSAARARLEGVRAAQLEAAARRDDLERLAGALRALVAVSADAAAADQAAGDAEARREAARTFARQATDEAAVADAALDELRRAHLVAALRATIVPGTPCPVCGQVVRDAAHGEPDDLQDVEHGVGVLTARAERATRALADADARARLTLQARDDSARRLVEAERAVLEQGGNPSTDPARLTAAAEQAAADASAYQSQAHVLAGDVERAAGALAETHRRFQRDRAEFTELTARLGDHGEHDDPRESLTRAVAALESAEATAAESGEAASRLAAAAAEADRAVGRLERDRLGQLRQSLTVLATRIGLPPIPSDTEAAELAERADELVSRASLTLREREEEAELARSQAASLEDVICDRGMSLGVVAPEDVAIRDEESARGLAHAQTELTTVEGHAAHARRLAAGEAAAAAEADLHAQLAVDLQANRFPRHLLARFHQRLASGASARLQNLSRGAFGFAGTEPDPLAVVDHRRGRRTRGAATLSGGERFLASLALALALADIASGSSGRLDCLFLDEGFSSLDGESLEVAIEGVERMADDGRLVVVITHLPGVAERLGAEIRIRKDPSGTSHVVDRT